MLTVYAATMLPLSLVAGFFGMNFVDLPLIHRQAGWIIVTGFMALVAFVAGHLLALGWTRRPCAGAVLGHGLIEAARAPAQLVGAVFEISTMPMRSVAGSVTHTRRSKPPSHTKTDPAASRSPNALASCGFSRRPAVLCRHDGCWIDLALDVAGAYISQQFPFAPLDKSQVRGPNPYRACRFQCHYRKVCGRLQPEAGNPL